MPSYRSSLMQRREKASIVHKENTMMRSPLLSHLVKCTAALIALGSCVVLHSPAQFLDDFQDSSLKVDRRGVKGWTYFTGDGEATMTFSASAKGYASICVDASHDTRGIWWALIKRRVSQDLDLSLLRRPNYALRIEARVRLSNAPRRVNLHLNTQRTTNFHTHLMEFDIADTVQWHAISMTTKNFDAVPGDSVYGQLALMDWGLGRYRVDVDYFRVDIVNVDSAGLDKGVQVPYRPPVPDVSSFRHHVPVADDAMVDLEYPDMNFNNWCIHSDSGKVALLTVSGTQFVIMRWDLSTFAGQKVMGSGVLELTTHALQRSPEYSKDFGMVRITEIFGGEPRWNQTDVTYHTLCRGEPIDRVMNSQMIIDVDATENGGSKNFITISHPVLQRMIDGKTLGLALKPLGAVVASFYSMENGNGALCPKLHFNIDPHSAPR
jgi:hypothetical protein